MMLAMPVRIAALLACLLLSASAAAETIYKYRHADGRTVYSNRLEPGLELIETFEYKIPAPAAKAKPRAAPQCDAEGEARIKKQLDALQAGWTEVQEATRALALAEERLRAGQEPQAGDRECVTGGSAPPAAGGVPASAAPTAGGAMSGRRGRPSPEYVARMDALEAGVRTARERLDTALRKYNQLR
jgi:hypothetical protein